MTYADGQLREIIPALDEFVEKAKEIARQIDYLQGNLQLRQDDALCKIYLAASRLVGTLTSASDEIKRGRADWVKECLSGWYRDLHWDMGPAVEIPEEDVADPEYESVDYKGHDEWEIIMTTPTHRREKVILRACNGIDWLGVYSAEPIGEEENIGRN